MCVERIFSVESCPKHTPASHLPGDPLRPSDLATLAKCGINADLAQRACLRRVDSPTGAQAIARNGSGDYSGTIYPYLWPGSDQPRDYRLRLDNPEMEWQDDGKQKPKAKYLSAAGRAPMLYIMPGTPPDALSDTSLPIIVTEGEKKAIALEGLAWYGLGDTATRPRWVPIGLAGVYGWRGKRGRTENAHGDWSSVKAPIADLDRVEWKDRTVIVIFDANVADNEHVQRARIQLARHLRSRGAQVYFVDIPKAGGANGVDDLVGQWGAERVLNLIETGAYDSRKTSDDLRLTELGVAERFVQEHGEDVRFCHQSREWFVWDGMRFAPDQTAAVNRLLKGTVRQLGKAAFDVDDEEKKKQAIRFAASCESDRSIRAVLNLASAEEDIPVLTSELDANPWLLSVINGTIDLRTGQLRDHDRADLISKLAPVRYDPEATCPRWTRFLEEVFEPHPDQIPFLQRAVGYSLTGDIREEVFFLLSGSGRNGKGTFLWILGLLFGDYGGVADFATFVQVKDDRGPRDDIQQMRGRRFISAQEVKERALLDEAKLKLLTGGDKVRARLLYQQSTEWLPVHKIWLGVNRKPIITGTDTGIWSRVRLVPFDVCFEGKEDKLLKRTLIAELSGILGWALRGCLAWKDGGLGESKSVDDATQKYRSDSDQVGRFIDERCITGQYVQARAQQLYATYHQWAESGGERPISQRIFSERLIERGFTKKREGEGYVYLGIGTKG